MNKNLLKEAIADAKAVKETALANAKIALEEAFTPRLKGMFSAKLAEELEDDDVDTYEEPITTDYAVEDDADEDLDGYDYSDSDINIEDEEEFELEEDIDFDDQEYDYSGYELVDDDFDEDDGFDEYDDFDEYDTSDINIYMNEGEDEEYEEDLSEDDINIYMDEDEEDLNEEDLDNYKNEYDEYLNEEDLDNYKNEYDEYLSEDDINIYTDEDEDDINISTTTDAEEDLEEAYRVIRFLKNKINEVNLLNAKLLYSNKLFRNNTLTEAQKLKVINNIDKAKNIREIKLISSALQESLTMPNTGRKSTLKESYASKTSKSTKPIRRNIISEGDILSRRFQKLAGLLKG